MDSNGSHNNTFLKIETSSQDSFLTTVQLVISALTPFLELARIILSLITFLLVHYSPLYRTTSFGLHIRCLAIYDACRVFERLKLNLGLNILDVTSLFFFKIIFLIYQLSLLFFSQLNVVLYYGHHFVQDI
jgi:hypothetical protein